MRIRDFIRASIEIIGQAFEKVRWWFSYGDTEEKVSALLIDNQAAASFKL